MKTINILGTEYKYSQAKYGDIELGESDGICNRHSKRIVVVDESGFMREASDTDQSIKDIVSKIKRHEIVHAYFAESGLQDYFNDETLVDWIAWHFPAMLKTMQEVEAI